MGTLRSCRVSRAVSSNPALLRDGSTLPRADRDACVYVGYLFKFTAMRFRLDGLQILGGEAGSDGEAEELRDRVGDG